MPLVLTRRSGETISIGDDIKVTITAIRGDQVRIAISAPRTVEVKRQELVDAAAEANRNAAVAAPEPDGELLRLLSERRSSVASPDTAAG